MILQVSYKKRLKITEGLMTYLWFLKLTVCT